MCTKKIIILGSTGSIGTQALDVIQRCGYGVAGLSAHTNTKLLLQQVEVYQPQAIAVTDEKSAEVVSAHLAGIGRNVNIFTGPQAARQLVEEVEADIVLNAIVGIAGLSSTLAALGKGTDVALANKESLVAGGQLVMDAAKKSGAKLLPVDSEHSAIFQCIQDAHSAAALEKILLTASGGPFYGKTAKELESVGKQQALNHPNWSMGPKITIDSATLMNKGLELIEAMWLFHVPPEKIEIVVQRESIIHSMVEFSDNSVLAQLGVPDMRIPIQYALTWPERTQGSAPKLDFTQIRQLSFGQADDSTFRCLAACRKAAAMGGLAPCAANGANEAAVDLFLQEKISFLDIGRLVESCVDSIDYKGTYTLQDVYDCDALARAYVLKNA